jgi:hypothetical protein
MSTGPIIIQTNRNEELSTQLNILNENGQGFKSDQETTIEEKDEEPEEPRDIATSEEFFNAIVSAYSNDKDLSKKILYTTLAKIRYYTFKDEINDQNAEDVIENVILLIAQGKRKWNKASFPNVINYLLVAIHSYIRNESKKKQKWKNEDIYDDEGNLKENQIEIFCREAVTDDLSEEFFKEKLEDLINNLEIKLIENGDDVAYCVMDEILKSDTEIIDNTTIALKLGISETEFKLAKRRIRYTIKQLQKNN